MALGTCVNATMVECIHIVKCYFGLEMEFLSPRVIFWGRWYYSLPGKFKYKLRIFFFSWGGPLLNGIHCADMDSFQTCTAWLSGLLFQIQQGSSTSFMWFRGSWTCLASSSSWRRTSITRSMSSLPFTSHPGSSSTIIPSLIIAHSLRGTPPRRRSSCLVWGSY